ncbi:hypothetical protein JW752_01975 [Candidatus Peregrinibacteria bacterium]|nr:hypothetical protein [Candidatus Peregrinibacteria bacterium]
MTNLETPDKETEREKHPPIAIPPEVLLSFLGAQVTEAQRKLAERLLRGNKKETQ